MPITLLGRLFYLSHVSLQVALVNRHKLLPEQQVGTGQHLRFIRSFVGSCWSWNPKTLATWCKGLTHWKRPRCWERLRAGEGGNWGWVGWMASPTRWTWVWVDFGSWWWTGRPGMLKFMGSQRVGYNWVTELNMLHKIKLVLQSPNWRNWPNPQIIRWGQKTWYIKGNKNADLAWKQVILDK